MEITPNPDDVAALVTQMEERGAQQPALIRDAAVNGYLLGKFAGMFVRAARQHGASCQEQCAFCDFLAEGLTVVSAHHVYSPDLAVHDIWGQSQ